MTALENTVSEILRDHGYDPDDQLFGSPEFPENPPTRFLYEVVMLCINDIALDGDKNPVNEDEFMQALKYSAIELHRAISFISSQRQVKMGDGMDECGFGYEESGVLRLMIGFHHWMLTKKE